MLDGSPSIEMRTYIHIYIYIYICGKRIKEIIVDGLGDTLPSLRDADAGGGGDCGCGGCGGGGSGGGGGVDGGGGGGGDGGGGMARRFSIPPNKSQ